MVGRVLPHQDDSRNRQQRNHCPADGRLAAFLTEPFVRAAVLGLDSLAEFDPASDRLRLYWASRQLFLRDRETWNILVREHVLRYLLPDLPLTHLPRQVATARAKLLAVLATAPRRIELAEGSDDA